MDRDMSKYFNVLNRKSSWANGVDFSSREKSVKKIFYSIIFLIYLGEFLSPYDKLCCTINILFLTIGRSMSRYALFYCPKTKIISSWLDSFQDEVGEKVFYSITFLMCSGGRSAINSLISWVKSFGILNWSIKSKLAESFGLNHMWKSDHI